MDSLDDLLNELVAESKEQQKAKGKKKAAGTIWRETAVKPAKKLLPPDVVEHWIVTQECVCGARHTYFAGRYLRRSKYNGGDNPAITSRESLPLHEALDLPQSVIRKSESVPVCPACIALVEDFDSLFAVEETTSQLELFN